MARSKHTKISAPSEIVPVARPVSTYVRPATPARSSLHDVAKGLGALDRGMSSFLKERQGKQDKADKIQGEAAFHKANQTGWAEAVKSGQVPANSSPIFMEAYKRQQGNLMGTSMRDNFNAAYQQWDGRNSDDPEVFQEFLSQFITEHVTTNDPDILHGLNPHLRALTENGYSAHSKQRASTIYNENLRNHGASQGDSIDEASGAGLENGLGTDYESLWGALIEQRQGATSTGTLESDYDNMLVESIIAKAVEHGDPQLLEFLDKTIPDEDHSLSSYPQYRDAKAKALDKLERMAVASMTRKDKAQEDSDSEEIDSYVRGAVDGLIKDPHAQVSDQMMKRWSALDPEGPLKFRKIRKSILEGGASEDPSEMLEIHRGIREGSLTVEDVNQLVLDGVIRTPQGFKSAHTELDRMAKSNRDGTGILREDTARRYISSFRDRTKDEDAAFFGMPGLTDDGRAATNHFTELLLDWEERNPDASKIDRVKKVIEIGDVIMGNIRDVDGKGGLDYAPPKPKNDKPEPVAEIVVEAPEVKQVEQPEVQQNEYSDVLSGHVKDTTITPPKVHPINGRPILDNGDGTFSSEELVTVEHLSINGGKPTNVPSIWGGQRVEDVDMIILYAVASGQNFDSYGTLAQAAVAVRLRRELLGEPSR